MTSEARSDYPECSGNPSSCPENEGYGCCKPNHASEARSAMTDLQAAFEKWYLQRYPLWASDLEIEDGSYRAGSAIDLWEGLQACAAHMEAENRRLMDRLEAAEAYIKEVPCDPDIYPEQFAAYQRWKALTGEKL